MIEVRDTEDMVGMMLSSGFGEPLNPRMVMVEEGVGGSDMYLIEHGPRTGRNVGIAIGEPG